MFLCNGSKTVDEAKEVMTAWYKNQDSYIDFLNSAPGHMLPVSKSMASAPKYNNHPLLVRYKKELDVLKDEIANGFPRVREGANRPLNLKMGEIMGSGIYAQMLQKVVIDNEKPKAAAVWAHDEIAKIMKG
jgi:multiple sugar transport system substrate-binding protein